MNNCKMRPTRKLYKSIVTIFCGAALLGFGIWAVRCKPLISPTMRKVREGIVLIEGTKGFDIWFHPIPLTTKIYLFHVTNPDDVMQGSPPKLVEYGPYVYDEYVKKEIEGIDEENDEIIYSVTHTFIFNKKKTGNLSENDQITMINSAYLGTINTLADSFPVFLERLGNDLPKLFPSQNTIFVKGKVKDILFDGLPLTCNSKKYPELALICNVLQNKRPPIIQATQKENSYVYSFLSKMNGTVQGPYTVNRGVKNISQLGDFTSIKGKRVLKNYVGKECNTVKGSDSTTWSPFDTRLKTIHSYILDACRSFPITYHKDAVINGLTGWKYVLASKIWDEDEIACYCPLDSNKKPKCLPRGVMDISKCQEVPIYMSEPHFLHGDSDLLNFAVGLSPEEGKHNTYIVIEPHTGIPLSGSKKLQLNMKLSKRNVELLSNVSEGFMPLIWIEQGAVSRIIDVAQIIQVYRLLNVLEFLQWVPVIVGIYVILASLFLLDYSKPKKGKTNSTLATVVLPTHDHSNLTHRQQTLGRRMSNNVLHNR